MDWLGMFGPMCRLRIIYCVLLYLTVWTRKIMFSFRIMFLYFGNRNVFS